MWPTAVRRSSMHVASQGSGWIFWDQTGYRERRKGSSSSQRSIATGRLTDSAETGEKVQVALQSAEVEIQTGLEFGLDNSLLDQMQQGIRAIISQ